MSLGTQPCLPPPPPHLTPVDLALPYAKTLATAL